MKVTVFQFSLFGINTYVVWDPATRDCAIIDPGMINDEERQALSGYISREKLHVTHIINTHLHIDHAIGDAYAKTTYGVPVYANRADEPLGERMQQQAASFGIPLDVKDAEITEYLEEGDEIHIGKGVLKVLHVPGHSPGSIVLYDEADHFIIAGDVLFQGSIGRTDLPGGSMPQLTQGIRDKLLPLPDNTTVYPGHGPSTTIGAERRSNPFLIGF